MDKTTEPQEQCFYCGSVATMIYSAGISAAFDSDDEWLEWLKDPSGPRTRGCISVSIPTCIAHETAAADALADRFDGCSAEPTPAHISGPGCDNPFHDMDSDARGVLVGKTGDWGMYGCPDCDSVSTRVSDTTDVAYQFALSALDTVHA